MPEGLDDQSQTGIACSMPPGLRRLAGSLDWSEVQELREINRAGGVMLNEAPYWENGFFSRHDVYSKSREAGTTYVGRAE